MAMDTSTPTPITHESNALGPCKASHAADGKSMAMENKSATPRAGSPL